MGVVSPRRDWTLRRYAREQASRRRDASGRQVAILDAASHSNARGSCVSAHTVLRRERLIAAVSCRSVDAAPLGLDPEASPLKGRCVPAHVTGRCVPVQVIWETRDDDDDEFVRRQHTQKTQLGTCGLQSRVARLRDAQACDVTRRL